MTTRFTGAEFFDLEAASFRSELFVESGRVSTDLDISNEVQVPAGFAFPAFMDGHCHPLFAGREAQGPQVSHCTSVNQIQQVLKDYRKQHPDELWIEGGAYDRNLAPLGKFLASWIDEVISDVPVIIHAADHHTIWVNSKALELLPKDLPSLSAGSIDLDDSGNASGVLREPEAMALVLEKAPPRTLAQEVEALAWADELMASQGIVFAQDAWITEGMTEVYLEALRLGRLNLEYNLAFKIEPGKWREGIEFAVLSRTKVKQGSNQVIANTVKFFADGVFGSATAAVLEPYDDPKGSLGEPLWTQDQLEQACLLAQQNGFQLHIHAIGDSGVRQALDAIEFVQAKLGKPKVPNVIAHAELISDVDLTRFGSLGVVANMQPLWAKRDGMMLSCLPRIGQTRLDSLYRMRDLIASSATIAFGSDWPVSSSNPLLGIATAISRAGEEDGASWQPQQALSILESLGSYSQFVNFQIFGDRGAPLKVGSRADFVILDTNLIEASPDEIRKAKVLATYRSGKRIY